MIGVLTRTVIDLKHFDEVLKYVNELSNTIDLDSTRVRAEALFYRFKRLVEATDRKRGGEDTNGLPEMRQRRLGGGGAGASSAGASSAGASELASRRAGGGGSSSGPDISDELRLLLSREVIRVATHQS